MMTIPSAPYKQIDKEEHLDVFRGGSDEGEAAGPEVPMAAGSRFRSCTPVPCWEEESFIKELLLLSVELIRLRGDGETRGSLK